MNINGPIGSMEDERIRKLMNSEEVKFWQSGPKEYIIEEKDWEELLALSRQANSGQRILTLNEASNQAKKKLCEKWRRVGVKMGFNWRIVKPVKGKDRTVWARPLSMGGKESCIIIG